MLAEMPLSDYWRWLARRRKMGWSFRNAELLLQSLNANVLNASGRFNPPLTADAFSVAPKQTEKELPSCNQAILNQILSESSSLSFDHVTE